MCDSRPRSQLVEKRLHLCDGVFVLAPDDVMPGPVDVCQPSIREPISECQSRFPLVGALCRVAVPDGIEKSPAVSTNFCSPSLIRLVQLNVGYG